MKRVVPGFVVAVCMLGIQGLYGQIIPPPRVREASAETGVYLVRFQPGVTAGDRVVAVQQAGGTVRLTFGALNGASVQLPNQAALASLRNHPLVLSVSPSRILRLAVQRGRGNPGGGGGSGGGGGGPKPKAPAGLGAAPTSSTEVALLWNDTSGNEDGVSIERCSGAGCSDFSGVGQVGPDTASYTDAGLDPSATYSYRVYAFNAAGDSKYSNVAEATTFADEPPPPAAPPAAPGGLTATAASFQVDVTWTDNSDNEDGFRIGRCQGTTATCVDADFSQIAQVGPGLTTYGDFAILEETSYTYRVLAYNAGGDSPWSNWDDAMVPSSGAEGQVTPFGVARIGAGPGELSVTGLGVGVAVVDTGLDFNHPDLGLAREIPGVNSYSAFYDSCGDFYGHGTHVAGTIAARNNVRDVVGVAPDATLYCVNVFFDDPVQGVGATDESLAAGLDWILTNADSLSPPIRVVNMSLGRDKTPDDEDPNNLLHAAIRSLHDRGISIVVSAGNDPLREVSSMVPAGFAEVMAVAATNAISGLNGYDDFFTACADEELIPKDTASYFTTDGILDEDGVGVTVSAPGAQREDIYDFGGDCYLEPIGILSTSNGGGTEQLMGTSMAAPHVTGVVALMWEAEQRRGMTLPPEVARTRIRNTVDRPGTAPLDSPILEYTFDGEREGVIWAPAAVLEAPAPDPDFPPSVTISEPASGNYPEGTVLTFAGLALDPEQGDISSSLVWTSTIDGPIGSGASFSRTISPGHHTVTATAADSGENHASATVDITVGSASQATQVSVSSIVWSESSNSLSATVGLSDEFGNPVAGALVSAEMIEWFYTLASWDFNSTTNGQGNVTFTLINPPVGCYLVDVTSVQAQGMTWVGGTPSNFYCY